MVLFEPNQQHVNEKKKYKVNKNVFDKRKFISRWLWSRVEYYK